VIMGFRGVVGGGGGGGGVTELDALIAYLQTLGTEVKFRDVDPAALKQ
jgi:cbb3-type cytochrome oxidase cytochrome c subunit